MPDVTWKNTARWATATLCVLASCAVCRAEEGTSAADWTDRIDQAIDARIAKAHGRVEAEPGDSAAKLGLALAFHRKAVRGDQDSVKTVKDILKSMSADVQETPRSKAISGSTLLLWARDAMMPWTKIERAKQGLAQMDQAVELAEEDVLVRLMRGASTWHLDERFERRAQAKEDLVYAASHASGALRNQRITASTASAAHYYLACVLESESKLDEARHHWRKAQTHDKTGPSGLMAAAKLQKYGEEAEELDGEESD